jgi:beta-N-acetylhexosaminidase
MGTERARVRRRRLLLAVGALAAFAIGAVLGARGSGGDGDGATAPGDRAAAPEATAAATPPPKAVDRLSLAQQVGRMVILRFAGTEAPGYVREALRRRRVAGVILFRDNAVDEEQVRSLTDSLRTASGDLEPLVCVDQEGGEVRILPWAPPERSAPEQQASGTVREDAAAAGRALAAAGANVTLAPVADLPSVDGSALAGRAFSSDSDAATAAIAESIGGWQDAGVATTVKHFPGLGGATVNTDDGPATIARTRRQLDEDLQPFVWAVEAGSEFVMASHATYPALDREHIASQSPAIIDGLLRDELGYEGVVMTDSLEAAAVQAVADVEEAAIASAEAGVDLILTTGRGSYNRVFRAMLARAREDATFRGRVRASAARVLAAQSSLDG